MPESSPKPENLEDKWTALRPEFWNRQRILLMIVCAPWIWVAGHMYFEGRRTADALCEIARPGMKIDDVIAKATREKIDFLDDRRYRREPTATDGYLMSLTSPFTVRRTCHVWFKDGIVRRVSNDEGPN